METGIVGQLISICLRAGDAKHAGQYPPTLAIITAAPVWRTSKALCRGKAQRNCRKRPELPAWRQIRAGLNVHVRKQPGEKVDEIWAMQNQETLHGLQEEKENWQKRWKEQGLESRDHSLMVVAATTEEGARFETLAPVRCFRPARQDYHVGEGATVTRGVFFFWTMLRSS